LATEEVGVELLAPRQVGGDVEGVVARADRSIGYCRHVEEQAHDVRV
jgi:hypothetical protein